MNDNSNNNNNNSRNNQVKMVDNPPGTVARCDHCGHVLPVENLALHVAACSSGRIRNTASSGTHRSETTHVPTNSNHPSTTEYEMVPCETCGRLLSAMSLTAHSARCQRQSSRDATTNQSVQPSSSSSPTTTSSTSVAATPVETGSRSNADAATLQMQQPNNEATPQNSPLEEEWSCPQCTLLNPITESCCEACGFRNQNSHQSQQQQQQEQNPTPSTGISSAERPPVQVEVQEHDPRMVNAVMTASNTMWWGLLGGMVAGPMGAAIGGTAGAIMSGLTILQNRHNGNNNNNQQRRQRPHITFASTHMGGSPGSSIVTFTTNTNGQWRTVTMRAPVDSSRMVTPGGIATADGSFSLSPIDQMIQQMLVAHALAQGADNVEQMSYEELLERFGVGTDHRRGLSPETIQSLPSVTLDETAIEALDENQNVCNICLEEFKQGDEMRKLHCKHAFHQQCIDRWLAQVASCPICKQELQNSSCSSTASSSSTTTTSSPNAQQQQPSTNPMH